MGLSHLKSFINRNYIIHIVEKYRNEKIEALKKNKYFNKKIFIFKKMPVKKKYLLTISSTPSKQRFSTMKKFFEANKTQFLLLEKFCFSSISQFNEFKLKFNKKTKIFVNSWGYILAKKTGLKNRLNGFKIICNIKEGNLLANITHLFHFFNYLNNKQAIENFTSINSKIIKNIKRKSYNELIAKIVVKDIKKNEMIIQTKKKMSDLMTFSIIQKFPKINFRLCIKNNNDIYVYNSGIKINKINFPYSSKTSFLFLKNSIKDELNFMPSFINDYELSKLILKNLNVKIP